ncbi:GDP-fucose transporter [Phaffia rhodozyma]|uniref:GDP-fucose transporter n=1 Tax=Phaffia rhodozyma TaxID=264483 RepID=A0A0F7SQU7_PHARH|nr:GDP-fucose transporter [Phaffia rhodozyma]
MPARNLVKPSGIAFIASFIQLARASVFFEKKTMSSQSESAPSRALVIATVTFYMISGIIMCAHSFKSQMVTVNKWVLIKTSIPVFFLVIQLAIAVVLLLISHFARVFVIPKMSLATVKGLWKLLALNVTGLCFNNFTLQYVDASFYQVARGMVLPLTVLITFIAYHSLPSRNALVACVIVSSGFFIGIIWGGNAQNSISPMGVMFGVLSSITTACHAIAIKSSLPVVDGSTMSLAWYSNFLSAIALLPISLMIGEGPEIMRTWRDPDLLNRFIWGGTITGFWGFFICLAGLLSIKVTSPVSHMVSSAARGVIQTGVSVWLFGDIINLGRGASISAIILGSCAYVYAKSKEAALGSPRPSGYSSLAKEDVEKALTDEQDRSD